MTETIVTPKIPKCNNVSDLPELVYSPDPLDLAERAALIARYYELLAEAWRIEAELSARGAE